MDVIEIAYMSIQTCFICFDSDMNIMYRNL